MVAFLSNFWWFLVLIGVMIVLHELGHYLMARLFDVKVETFSLGFGPRLFGTRGKETDFCVCAIPLGGYVKMTGEQPGEGQTTDPRALTSKPRWQRLLIAFAGPLTNIILAVVLLTGLFMVEYAKVPNPKSPIVGHVDPNGAADKAGIRVGDQVVQIDGIKDPTWETIAVREYGSAKESMDVYVIRNGQRLNFSVTPTYDEKQGVGYAGWLPESDVQMGGYCCGIDVAQRAGLQRGDIFVSLNGIPIHSSARFQDVIEESKGTPVDVVYSRNGQLQHVTLSPVWGEAEGKKRWRIGALLEARVEITKLPFGEALAESWRQNVQNTKLLYKVIEGMLERRMSPKSLEGPIRIAQLSGQAAREGATSFIGLMAAVSLNLAIFNLLPIPILDGGVMLMLLVEMLLRRDLDLKVKEAVVRVGFVFLMVVVVFVLYNDISKILPPG
jgi:regulator of sigma E protease